MELVVASIVLVLGFIGLWISSERTIDYASQTAMNFGLSKMFVGFMLLAISTGLPELFVAMQALISNKPLLSAGDILGSNFLDVSLALGLAATVYGPLEYNHLEIRRSCILLIVSASLMGFVFFVGTLTAPIGMLLVCIYILGIWWLYHSGASDASTTVHQLQGNKNEKMMVIMKLILWMLVVVASAKLCVESGLSIAEHTHIPLAIIGSLIFSLGTSLPEIMLNLQAARKKQFALALGNSLGSVFEQGSLILGILSIGSQQPISLTYFYHLGPFLALAYALVAIQLLTRRSISRGSGLMLLGTYAAFVIYEILFVLIKNI